MGALVVGNFVVRVGCAVVSVVGLVAQFMMVFVFVVLIV